MLRLIHIKSELLHQIKLATQLELFVCCLNENEIIGDNWLIERKHFKCYISIFLTYNFLDLILNIAEGPTYSTRNEKEKTHTMGKQNPQYIEEIKHCLVTTDDTEMETQKPEEPWPLSYKLPRWESNFIKRINYLATRTIAQVQNQY